MEQVMFRLADPDLQAGFAARLVECRRDFLQEALLETMGCIEVSVVDYELKMFVGSCYLSRLAGRGMRGELVFSVPSVLRTNPRLLGYYRLLLGYSQKTFYGHDSGISPFKSMEERGVLNQKQTQVLGALSAFLIDKEQLLLEQLPDDMLNSTLFRDLTLLTLGTQLRGGSNVQIGVAGGLIAFALIRAAVLPAITDATTSELRLRNAAGQHVIIRTASDPDITILGEMNNGVYRPILAIEIKGGRDFANVHNRVGEAEKSHQKAKYAGYHERWTLLNVARTDMEMARRESPSTTQFYLLSELADTNSSMAADFMSRVQSLVGIAG